MSGISVDPLFLTVSRIATFDQASDQKPLAYGTGFFYTNSKDELFLITNRHVIIRENDSYVPNIARLTLHTNPNNLSQNRDYDISLYIGTKQAWCNPNPATADVVAIPLNANEILQQQRFLIKAFSGANLLPQNYRLQIGEDVMIMGYPLGAYYDDVANLPVVRNGIVASAYPVPFRGNPYFLVDARLHKGTSGSPVMTKSKGMWSGTDGSTMMTGFQFFLLGVNSSTWQLPKEEEPLGLNATVFASIVDDMTK